VVDLYAGERWIPELRLYDLRNRFMSSELGRFLQPDPIGLQTEGEKLSAGQKAFFFGGHAPEAFSSTEMNLYRYCHNDPVDKSDPFGLIDPALLEKLKEHLRKIETDQRKDHNDRTLGTKKDLTPGKETIGTLKTNHTMGRFERDKMKTEVLPESNKDLAGTSHYHSAPYYKVNDNNTALPSKGADVSGVRLNGIPMLFGSDPLKGAGRAILIEPRKGQEPSQETIKLQYDK
jgi:RHS repeat-associated protein